MTLYVDTVIRARQIHTFAHDLEDVQALGILGGKIVATGAGDDNLEALVGPRTRIVDAPESTIMPSFYDTHNHLLLTAVDKFCFVDLSSCKSIDDVVAAIAAKAQTTPSGQWIVSSRHWQDSNLRESRLPFAEELDRATSQHPVCLKRDGHVMVVNTRGLEMAGLRDLMEDPVGGTLGRHSDGMPNGQLFEFAAYRPVNDLLPEPTIEEKVEALGQMCRAVNARGMTAVRDPGLTPRGELDVYQVLRERGGLTVRTRALLFVRVNRFPTLADAISGIDAWGVRSDFGDDLLRVDGIKTSLDGGIEGAALGAPYIGRPDYSGHLLIEPDALTEFVTAAVDKGYRVGCHAVGDRAVDTAVTAFENVLASNPTLPPGWLSVEHAFFADEAMRKRVVDAGIGVTVQFPIASALGTHMVEHWGADRANAAMPIREWVDEGAIVSGGTDSNVSRYDPLLAIWETITRKTQHGEILGAAHAVDRRTAFELYSIAGPRAFGESDTRGTLVPGHWADMVAFDTDPLECDVDAIPELDPVFTLLGGRAVHDRTGVARDAGDTQ
ncbi:amidohydrolase [Rhodococcus sp. 1R11]|uniref:amidohydrolase n=1 Tax=Rhodococcus sp. 1R11 TaxID=2559614 RepID=UPI00107180F9|nr:amidohydrolase [Rhodococcus sp. 1R11]TFI42481.1 amidohydrolase [Rhodococcus sp. 1R11]